MSAHVVLALTVAGQLCGIPVSEVRDVLDRQAFTRVPLAPPEVAGNLNLRGRVVTAIDLRRRLGLPPDEGATRRMSVVTEHCGEFYALVVDQVSEVMTLPEQALERCPPALPAIWTENSEGVVRLPQGVLVVLNLDRLLTLAPRPARDAA